MPHIYKRFNNLFTYAPSQHYLLVSASMAQFLRDIISSHNKIRTPLRSTQTTENVHIDHEHVGYQCPASFVLGIYSSFSKTEQIGPLKICFVVFPLL